jgi:hypothetical protein
MDIIPLDGLKWFYHPNGDDIAVCPVKFDSGRHKVNFINLVNLLTKEIVDNFKIGIGDDVFFAGRFVNHEGTKRNSPTLRFGNIAQMPLEPIKQSDGFEQESFLIEARSLPGYSGSPVFVHILPMPPLPPMSPEMREHVLKLPNMRPERSNLPIIAGPWLLGIDYCQIRMREPVMSEATGKQMHDWFVYANTGMMGVIPAWKLREVFDGDELMAIRKDAENKERKRRADSHVGLD